MPETEPRYNASTPCPTTYKLTFVVSGNLISLKQGSWEISGAGAGMTLRFYPRRTAPHGFYCGLSVMAGAVSVKYTDPYGETLTGRGASVGVGGIAGFQWISRDGFTFDLNASVTVGLSQISAGEYSTPAGSVTPSIGLSMGYRKPRAKAPEFIPGMSPPSIAS